MDMAGLAFFDECTERIEEENGENTHVFCNNFHQNRRCSIKNYYVYEFYIIRVILIIWLFGHFTLNRLLLDVAIRHFFKVEVLTYVNKIILLCKINFITLKVINIFSVCKFLFTKVRKNMVVLFDVSSTVFKLGFLK